MAGGFDRRDWETPLGSLAVVDTQEQFLFNELYASTARRVSEKFNLLTYRVDSLDPNDHALHHSLRRSPQAVASEKRPGRTPVWTISAPGPLGLKQSRGFTLNTATLLLAANS